MLTIDFGENLQEYFFVQIQFLIIKNELKNCEILYGQFWLWPKLAIYYLLNYAFLGKITGILFCSESVFNHRNTDEKCLDIK